MRKALLVALAVLGVFVAGLALFAGSGIYNVAADEPHGALVSRLLATVRERSIRARATHIDAPELDDPARVRRGAGNYDAMCKGCHLAPGMTKSELSAGLYPSPPNLSERASIDSSEAFWIVKHGIKATGMPAWGKSMDDGYIWDIVAFLTKLPALSPGQYKAEVATSGGHSHGDSESEADAPANEAKHDHGAEHDDAEHDEGSTDEHSHDRDTQGENGTAVATAKALHAALSSGNAAQVQTLLDPNVLIMEGGGVERSRKEYAAHHLPSDLEFMKSVAYKLERQTADSVGDLAWVASEARLTGSREGKPLNVASTETLVLRKSAAGWKVVHIHWSSRTAKK